MGVKNTPYMVFVDVSWADIIFDCTGSGVTIAPATPAMQGAENYRIYCVLYEKSSNKAAKCTISQST